jgi:Dynamin family
VDQPKLFYTATQKEVMDACQELHTSIMPLNAKVRSITLFAGFFPLNLCNSHAAARASLLTFACEKQIRGPLAPQSDRGTALPFVLLVGNHSSGKSSFINYLLGRKIQTTGVAPTDDGT